MHCEQRQAIGEAGLRGTASRIAVLRLLETAGKPLSHAEVCRALSASGFDKATLYRNLIDLTEGGLLSRIDVGDHTWRFEFRYKEQGPEQEHPHFVCAECGAISCLFGVRIQISSPTQFSRALKAGAITIQFKGRCDQCAAVA
ncbi:MAG: transcriptional repressor [Deltaproteobacteria bacterium]|nr:transcriptional repressor [Deltaproteobacteria bacterium]